MHTYSTVALRCHIKDEQACCALRSTSHSWVPWFLLEPQQRHRPDSLCANGRGNLSGSTGTSLECNTIGGCWIGFNDSPHAQSLGIGRRLVVARASWPALGLELCPGLPNVPAARMAVEYQLPAPRESGRTTLVPVTERLLAEAAARLSLIM